eukprot:1178134-Amphidinium_carterae.1
MTTLSPTQVPEADADALVKVSEDVEASLFTQLGGVVDRVIESTDFGTSVAQLTNNSTLNTTVDGQVQVVVPPSASSEAAALVMTLFNSDASQNFNSSQSGQSLVSEVLVVRLLNEDGSAVTVENLSEPVKTVWAKANAASSALRAVFCAYWVENGGYWSTEGLTTETIGTDVHCLTTHMTIFGLIDEPTATSSTSSTSPTSTTSSWSSTTTFTSAIPTPSPAPDCGSGSRFDSRKLFLPCSSPGRGDAALQSRIARLLALVSLLRISWML